MDKTFSYGRKEKLKGRKMIEQLFSKGKSFTVFPIKIFYLQPGTPLDFSVKAGVGVSARNFKKAVERNRIKRLLREAYRTEKLSLHLYLKEHNTQLIMFLLYTDKLLPDYAALKAKMPLLFEQLIKRLNEAGVANT
ncbi:MAG TPA: ribonuclease P protein component [Chitinophagaceae bacterium]|jgi:ribonuclease P protein component